MAEEFTRIICMISSSGTRRKKSGAESPAGRLRFFVLVLISFGATLSRADEKRHEADYGKVFPAVYFPVLEKSRSAICQPSGSPAALLPLADLVSPHMVRQ